MSGITDERVVDQFRHVVQNDDVEFSVEKKENVDLMHDGLNGRQPLDGRMQFNRK